MKKHLLDVCRILLDKFTNRYHDYDGYWGIGVLYTHAKSLNSMVFEFDLLDKYCIQQDLFLLQVQQKFQQDLVHYLNIHRKKLNNLQVANIEINFDDQCLIKEKTLYGHYFTVKVKIIDREGRSFSAEANGYCVPHKDWTTQRNYIDSLPDNKKQFYWEVG